MAEIEDIEEIKEQKIWYILHTLLFLTLIVFSTIFLYSLDKLSKQASVFDFILMGIAVFRLVHLFVHDFIIRPVRDYFAKFKKGPFRSISRLLSCPWCVGIWTALIVGFFYYLTPYAWYAILIIALAGVGSFIDLASHRLTRS